MASLIAAAGLLRDHTLLMIGLGVVAAGSVGVIVWDVRPPEGTKARWRRRWPQGGGGKVALPLLMARAARGVTEAEAVLGPAGVVARLAVLVRRVAMAGTVAPDE